MNSRHALLWLFAFSSLASWLDLINILTKTGYELDAGPLQVAAITLCIFLPQVMFGSLFKYAAIKFSLSQIMAITLVGRGIVMIGLALANDVVWLAVLVFLRSFLIGFLQPVIASNVQGLSKQANIAAHFNFISTATKIVAPSIGGVLAYFSSEDVVFLLSAGITFLSLVFVLYLPLTNNDQSEKPSTQNSRHLFWAWIGFGLPILWVEGLGVFVSNLMPYTLNFYSVPKWLLSVSLTASAIASLVTSSLLMKYYRPDQNYPAISLFYIWAAISVGFISLALTIPVFYLLIPCAFMAVSAGRCGFDVLLNGYIFKAPLNNSEFTLRSLKVFFLKAISRS